MPWGFKRKKLPDEGVGGIQIDPDGDPVGEPQRPVTMEESGRGAARVLGFIAFLAVALSVGWLGSVWASLVPPSIAGLLVWLGLRRHPILAVRIIQFAVFGVGAWALYYLASLFGLIGNGPTP